MNEDNKYKFAKEAFLEWCKETDDEITRLPFTEWAEDKYKPTPTHEEELREKWEALGKKFYSQNHSDNNIDHNVWFNKAKELGLFTHLLDKFKDEIIDHHRVGCVTTGAALRRYINELHKKYTEGL